MATATFSLLTADKLTDENYASWKNTINTILVIDDLRFVLIEECPSIPPPNTARNVRDAYEHWTRVNEKVRAYILANLNDVFAKKHEPMIIAREIIVSFRGMFGQPSAQLRHDALKYIFN
ncbi:uncharacterized protein LOC120073504 [Benincasa hispida]|uniref:uncharacterized protein LOC120073504 n=1 Tax=Benincasa hispida TaxID=102211 RepID=UPI00190241E3|nr:uncharacterized protein LOC120073504 [Benincasa hispida]